MHRIPAVAPAPPAPCAPLALGGNNAGRARTGFAWHMAVHHAPLVPAVVLPLSGLIACRRLLARAAGKP